MPNYESYSGPAGLPDDCTAITLPTSDYPECAAEYEAHESEITDLWIMPAEQQVDGTWQATALPADWTVSDDLDNLAGVAKLSVIGDKPLPEVRTVALAKGEEKISTRVHTVNADITHMTTNNYELVRALQNGSPVFIWYADVHSYSTGETGTSYVYGGANGVFIPGGAMLNAGNVLGRGEGTLLTGQIVFQWLNQFDPPVAILDEVGALTAPQALKSTPAKAKDDKKEVKKEAA